MRQFQLILFVLFSGIFSGFSQHGKSKMTEEEFHEMRYEIEKIQTSNKDSVFVLVDDMMKIANSFKDDQILAKALLTKADVRSKYKDQVQAIATINEAIKINKRQNNKAELALCYYILGKCYAQKADHIEATKYYLKAIETTKEKDSVIIVKAYSGLTMVSVAQANYQNGLKYNLLAEKYTTKSTPEELIAHNLMIKGVIYRFLEDFKKADTYLSKAATLFKKINNKFNLASTLNEQSDLYLESDPLKCIDLKLEAKALLDEIAPERSTTAYCLSILGDLYITVATNDSLLKNIKNPIVPKTKIRLFNDAESFYLRALDITKKTTTYKELVKAYYTYLYSKD